MLICHDLLSLWLGREPLHRTHYHVKKTLFWLNIALIFRWKRSGYLIDDFEDASGRSRSHRDAAEMGKSTAQGGRSGHDGEEDLAHFIFFSNGFDPNNKSCRYPLGKMLGETQVSNNIVNYNFAHSIIIFEIN